MRVSCCIVCGQWSGAASPRPEACFCNQRICVRQLISARHDARQLRRRRRGVTSRTERSGGCWRWAYASRRAQQHRRRERRCAAAPRGRRSVFKCPCRPLRRSGRAGRGGEEACGLPREAGAGLPASARDAVAAAIRTATARSAAAAIRHPQPRGPPSSAERPRRPLAPTHRPHRLAHALRQDKDALKHARDA